MDQSMIGMIRLSDVPPDLDSLLDEWTRRFSGRSSHVRIVEFTRYDNPTEGDAKWAPDVAGGVQQRIALFTDNNEYQIVARFGCAQTYLSCMAKSRKPRAGEDWHRGSDLADGQFTYETWFRILAEIVSYELVPVAKPKRPVADGQAFPSSGPIIFPVNEVVPIEEPAPQQP